MQQVKSSHHTIMNHAIQVINDFMALPSHNPELLPVVSASAFNEVTGYWYTILYPLYSVHGHLFIASRKRRAAYYFT
jgi:hypothetical protein